MLKQRFSRRQFLKLTGAAVACALLDVTVWRPSASAAASVRSEWTFRDGFPVSGTFETPPLTPGTPFDAVDVAWLDSGNSGLRFALRTQAKDGSWSDWIALHPDEHARDAMETQRYIAPVICRGQAVQVRVTVEPGAALHEFTVGAIDTSGGIQAQTQSHTDGTSLIDGFIISRAGWGADESLRYEDRDPTKPVIWEPEYQPVQKIILHHTVTENDPDDPAAAVRAVYYYHAVTRGWGDIGYNFLVDMAGNVYEGRYGGEDVIGGHALQYNRGSMGIAFLGNFDYAKPPEAMINALVKLIQTRAPQVDVTKATDFLDLLKMPNLCGHQDVIQTACPGGYLYPLLPDVRGLVAGTDPVFLPPPIPKERLDLLDLTISPATVYLGNLLEVRFKVRNSGASTIASCGPETGYIYEGGDFESAGFPKVEGAYRLCLDFDDNPGLLNPYRWGLGEPMVTGEEREIVGYIRVMDVGAKVYSASIVKEYIRYQSLGVWPTTIRAETPPVHAMPASGISGVRFFPETGHNVPEIFITVWDEQGGLRRFGYPLTEAFYELSETDGVIYLTQYFERARFEWHPEFAGTEHEVLFGLLGNEMMELRRSELPFQPIAPVASTPDRVFYPETGHSLGGVFKRIWEERGGLRIFGYPISEEFEELSDTDGKMHVVQYFERNRFEYHPDFSGTEYEVMLGHLGREMLIRRGWLKRPFE